jgi:hypothetical protein
MQTVMKLCAGSGSSVVCPSLFCIEQQAALYYGIMEVNLYYIFEYCGKNDRLFYYVSKVGNSIFLIGACLMMINCSITGKNMKFLLCSITKLIEENYISLTDLQYTP